MEAIKKVKPELKMTANSEVTLFLANRTVSMEEMPPTRRYIIFVSQLIWATTF